MEEMIMRKCRHCRQEIPKRKDCTDPYQRAGFCSKDHAVEHESQKALKALEKKKAAERRNAQDQAKRERQKHREDKKRVRKRSEWLDMLQSLKNQYVVHVRDAGEPCCTCGTSSPDIKYDAGHCFTRGARPEIRFELTNIHKQCSVNCNQHHSGKQGEHKAFIAEKYGVDHLAKLEDRTQWPSLKEQFPDWQSIEAEIKRWRSILREHGITPRR